MGFLGGLGEDWSFVLLTMEVSSEGEKKPPPPVEATKTKRKMKTASQLEILEKAYMGVWFLCYNFFSLWNERMVVVPLLSLL